MTTHLTTHRTHADAEFFSYIQQNSPAIVFSTSETEFAVGDEVILEQYIPSRISDGRYSDPSYHRCGVSQLRKTSALENRTERNQGGQKMLDDLTRAELEGLIKERESLLAQGWISMFTPPKQNQRVSILLWDGRGWTNVPRRGGGFGGVGIGGDEVAFWKESTLPVENQQEI